MPRSVLTRAGLLALLLCHHAPARDNELHQALHHASTGHAERCLTHAHRALATGPANERASALYWAARCASAASLRTHARAYAHELLRRHPDSLHAQVLTQAQRARHLQRARPDAPSGRALLEALIHTESAFDPRAVSPKDALGLMQVTVGAAAGLVPAGRDTRECLLEARCNLAVGTAYFNRLNRRFEHDLCATLVAYNAGPARAARWRATRPTDPVLALDLIPITETRHYVRKVLTRLWRLQRAQRIRSPSLYALSQAQWPRQP